MGHGGDNKFTVVFESNKSSVEQVIDRRRQQQSVFAVEALFVIGISPGFAVTSTQVLFSVYTRNSARTLKRHYTLLEKTLPAACHYHGLTHSLWYMFVFPHAIHFMLLPLEQSDCGLYRCFFSNSVARDYCTSLGTKKIYQCTCKAFRQGS